MRQIIIFLLILLMGSCAFFSPTEEPKQSSPLPITTPAPRSIVYDVTSTSLTRLVTITIQLWDGGYYQYSNYTAPWTYSYAGQQGDYVNLFVENLYNGGDITATVTIDGSVWKTMTSIGSLCTLKLIGYIP